MVSCMVLPVQMPLALAACRSSTPISTPISPTPQLGDTPRPAEPLSPAPQQQARSDRLTAMEFEVQRQVNAIRRVRGLATLRSHTRLAQVARNHSRNMATQRFFAHRDPRGQGAFDRVQAAGIPFRLVAENLFLSENIPNPVPQAIKDWMQSRGHRANILRTDVTQTGVGVVQRGNTYYLTQLFIR